MEREAQSLNKFPIGNAEIAGEHALKPSRDRLSNTTAGFSLPGKLGSMASELTIEIAPHEGYRRYLGERTTQPQTLDLLNAELAGGNFPAVRYAAGWAHAERAMTAEKISFDDRFESIRNAVTQWQIAKDLIPQMYETYPGYFLVWPCSMWRYQLAIDCAPSILAIADVRSHGGRSFDRDLLEQSRANTRETLKILLNKYRWTERQEHQPGANKSRVEGRKGAILGVALEAVALNLGQLGAGNSLSLTAPSLRLDNANHAGADLSAYTTRDWIFTAQVKNRVDNLDRRKYKQTNLICAVHHMRIGKEPVINTIEAIVNNTRHDELRKISEVVLSATKGSRKHGCSQFHKPTQPKRLRNAA